MYKLAIPPDSAAYSLTDGNEVLSVQLDGGYSRYRRDLLGAAAKVNVTWTISSTDYEYLRAFYNVVGRAGERFAVDLVFEGAELTQYEGYFVPGTLRLSSQVGRTYVVEAQLEVLPQPGEYDYDLALIRGYSARNGGASPRQFVVTEANRRIDVIRVSDSVAFLGQVALGTYRSPKHFARAVNLALRDCGWSNGWNVHIVGANGFEQNPGFEQGLNGWGAYNNSDVLEPGVLSRLYAAANDPCPEGRYYAKYSWTINNTTQKGIYCNSTSPDADGIPIFPGWVPGVWNVVRFKARASGTNVGRTLSLQWNAGPNTTLAAKNPPLSAVWQEYEFHCMWTTNNIPPGELHVSIGSVGTNGSLDFDDFSMYVDNGLPGRMIISGNANFSLPFSTGANNGVSIRDLAGYGQGDYLDKRSHVSGRSCGALP